MTQADDRPATPSPDIAVLCRARAIHDMATLRTADYSPGGYGRWVIALIRPDPGSGAATVPGAYVDGDTGALVNPTQADAVLVKKGQWETVGTSPTGSNRGRYEWHEALDRRLRTLSPEDLYSPFVYGGTVVFTLTAPSEDGEPFGAARLLFPEWSRSVEDALNQAPQFERLLTAGIDRAGYFAEVNALLAGHNPLTATLAFRHLLLSPDATLPSAAALLRTDDVRKLAVLIYLALSIPAAAHRAYWDEQITRLLRDTSSPERLLAIGHAAFAVSLFQTGHPSAFASAQTLTRALLGHVRALQIDIERDPAWRRIFNAVTLPGG